jgi:hypothetical protein
VTYDVGNPGPGLGQAQIVAGLNRLMDFFRIIFKNYSNFLKNKSQI